MKNKTAIFNGLKFKDLRLGKKMTRELVIVIGGALVIAIAYINFFIRPMLLGLYGTIPQVQSLKANIEKTKNEISREDELTKKQAGLQNELKGIRTRLPAEKEIPALLESLSSMARNSNITIIGITPGSLEKPIGPPKEGLPVPFKTYQEIPILISARSGYHELGKFINDLENLDRFMEASDIKIKANAKNPRRHDIELKISTYILLSP